MAAPRTRSSVSPLEIAKKPALSPPPVKPVSPALPPPPLVAAPITFSLPEEAEVSAALASPPSSLAELRHVLAAHALSAAETFEELLALRVMTNIEPHRYQIETMRRVLRFFRGRALLADEVGLGKTIEALMILREYQLRGVVRRALVIVPPALVVSAEKRTAEQREALAALAKQAKRVSGTRKSKALVDLVRAHSDQVLVFTRFRETLADLERTFGEAGIAPLSFHGGLSAEAKQRSLAAFRAGGRVLLATDVGGEGQNLHHCHVLVNFDLPYNPMLIEQRIGRLHRMGQREEVRVYNLCAKGSAEERVLDLLDRRLHLFELVVGEMDMVLGNLSDERDLEERIVELYATSRTDAEIEQGFDAIADELAAARGHYERVVRVVTAEDGAEPDEAVCARLDPTWPDAALVPAAEAHATGEAAHWIAVRTSAAVRAAVAPLLAEVARRHGRDHERIAEYFAALIAEARAPRRKVEPKAVEAKVEHLMAERDKKLRDLGERFAVRVQATPAALVSVEMPCALLEMKLRRRKETREIVLRAPSGAYSVDRLACEGCGATTSKPAACDERLHLLCEACVPNAQGRFACPACAKWR